MPQNVEGIIPVNQITLGETINSISPLDNLPDDLRKEIESKGIFYVVQNSYLYEIKISREGRKLNLEIKQVQDARVQDSVKKSIKAYNSIVPVFVNVIGSGCALAAPFAPGIGPVLSVAGNQVYNAVSSHVKSHHDGKHTGYNAVKDMSSNFSSELNRRNDTAEQSTQQSIQQITAAAKQRLDLMTSILTTTTH